MLNNKTVAVVIPTYNEESQIMSVLNTMPAFVDRIIIVNDSSTDKTEEIVKKYIKKNSNNSKLLNKNIKEKGKNNKYSKATIILNEMEKQEKAMFVPSNIFNKNPEKDRIILINHEKNSGVGAAISTGYNLCKRYKIDCTAVMAGDGQMDPDELKKICLPIINDEVDYTKANRLSHRSAFFVIPKIRFFGNSILSLLTKIASGYWHISDTQSGFTAISLNALNGIRIHRIYKGYGNPNDILVRLNIAFCSIKEIPSKPVYNVGEKSKLHVWKVIPRISFLLFKSFFKRLYFKYLFRSFHPLFLLYHFAFVLLIINIPFAIRVLTNTINPKSHLSLESLLIFIFLTISGLQSLFFAMWMDMMDNERLQK